MTRAQRSRRILATTLTLLSLSGLSLAVRAQDAPPPPAGAVPSVMPAPAPGDDAPPAPPAAPPPGQPSYPPAYAPPGYAPGYGPPAYRPGYTAPAYAPPGPAEPTHNGVYVHLHVGGGFTSIKGSDGNGNTIKLSGGGPSFTVAVGGAVAPNLALFGNFFLTFATQPQVSSSSYGNGQATGDALFGGLGAGVVYYFMPANIYLSGAIGAVHFQADDSNSKVVYTSATGVGFQALIGKEFWVSDHWGLGAALELMGGSAMKDKDNPAFSWSAGAFNLLFSATCF